MQSTGRKSKERAGRALAQAIRRVALVPEALEQRVLLADFAALINFQPSTAPAHPGYLVDSGMTYGSRGNGLVYGWNQPVATAARDRDAANSPSQLYDTLIHSQIAGTFTWELAVPNGTYDVKLVAGDPSYTDSIYKFDAESTPLLSGTPSAQSPWVQGAVTVNVADGKLTITNASGSSNNKLAFIEVRSAGAALEQPRIIATVPAAGATNVSRDAFIGCDLSLPNGALDSETVNSTTVTLRKTSTGALIQAVVNTSGGGDSIVLQPSSLLEANTQYTFAVSSGVMDEAGASLVPFSMSFTTGAQGGPVVSEIKFQKVELPSTEGKAWTSVVIGPDRNLYAGTLDGFIYRFPINSVDGTVGAGTAINAIRSANGGNRMLLGLVFDPASTATDLKLWVTHGDFSFDTTAQHWSGKLTVLSGPDLATAPAQDVLVGLPRAAHNHLTNQAVFGPDGALYISQGGNTAQGARDSTWGLRDESLLSAAILRFDTTRVTPGMPLNVQTIDGGGTYNPFAANAPLTVYASGLRNAYDLVWTADGKLYAPNNGSNLGGATPATPSPFAPPYTPRIDQAEHGAYIGPQVPALNPTTKGEPDYLYKIDPGGFYGHPNPSRHEYVLNGGNPTSGVDAAEITQYPVGTLPDRNYRGFAYSFGAKLSPNGVIEYRSNSFNGALKGKLLVARYSGGDDLIVLSRNPNGSIAGGQTGHQGLTSFADPLDLIEDTTNGYIYVAEFGGDDDKAGPAEPQGMKITLLRPIVGEAAPAPIGNLTSQDIGADRPGSTTKISDTAYDVVAGGPDIYGTVDGFRFDHQLRTGDFDVRVRVDSLTRAADASKAGLMVRDGLGTSAKNFYVSITASKTFRIGYRTSTGGSTKLVHGDAPTFPGWLRITREGNTFSGYSSLDGAAWKKIGQSVTLDIPSTANFGLATSTAATNTTVTAQYRELMEMRSSSVVGPWASGPQLPVPMSEVGGAVIGAKLYAVGEGAAGAMVLDLANNTWSEGAARPFVGEENDAEHAVEAFDGKLYLFGGIDLDSRNKTQIYDPIANSWSLGANQPFDAGSSNTALINGQIYVAGGAVKYPQWGSVSTAARYSPSTNTWSPIAPMPSGRHSAAYGTDGQKLYVFGGRDAGTEDSSGTDTVQIYDPQTNTWQTSDNTATNLPPVPRKIRGTSRAVFFNGEFYIFGGETSFNTDPDATADLTFRRVDIYNPTTRSWRLGADMPTARHALLAASYQDKIYTIGGGTVRGTSRSQIVEVLTPPAATALPIVTVSATDPNAAETAQNTGTYTITRTGATTSALTVAYRMGGTASSADYAAMSGSAIIPAGAASVNVVLTPVDDQLFEGYETAVLALASGTTYAVGAPSKANVTIVDNDSASTVTVTASDPSASEGGPDNGQYTFTRSGSTASSLTVAYTMGGTASSADYAALSGSAIIPAGSASVNLVLTPVDDQLVEGSESAVLTLANGTGYTLGVPASATVTIADNDSVQLPTITVTATDASASETGPNTGQYTFTRSGSTASSLAVSYTMSGTAGAGDYAALSGVVNFAAGAATATVLLTPIDDTVTEPDETAVLTLASGSSYIIGSPSSATVTIADNDAPVASAFTSTDINATPAGSTTEVTPNVAYDIVAGGLHIGGAADGIRFLHQQKSGDFDVAVRIDALNATTIYSKAGLMARETLTAGSRNVFAGATASSGWRFSYRLTTDGGSTNAYKSGAAGFPNAWVRLRRVGDTFTGFSSTNGTTWTQMTQVTMALPGTLFLGLATNSNSTTATTNARYRSMSGFGAADPDPGPTAPATPSWFTAQAASSTQINLSWNASSGATLYRIQRKAPGQSSFVDFDTTSTTTFADTSVTGGNTYSYQVRAENGTLFSSYTAPLSVTTPATQQPPAAPASLSAAAVSSSQIDLSWPASAGATLYRIQRMAPGQQSFTDLTTVTTNSFQNTGLAASSTYSYQVRAENAAGPSAYSPTASATTQAAPTQAYFTSTDVAASPAGSTTVISDGSAYDVVAGGPNISGTSDGFRYLHRQQTGDFDVKVRVQSLTNTDPTAKAGIMARESLTANSRHVFSSATAADSYRVTYRSSTGAKATHLKAGAVNYTSGVWVRLVRQGNVFTGYHSVDGVNWTQTAQVNVSLPATVHLGLATSPAASNTTTRAQYRDYSHAGPSAPQTQIAWTNAANAPLAIQEGLSVHVGNKLFLWGGYAENLIAQTAGNVLNLDTGVWSAVAPLRAGQPQTHGGIATDGRFVYFIGGQFGNGGSTDIRAESWKYNIATNTFSSFTALPEARGGGALVYQNGFLHYFGGFLSDRITISDKHWAIPVDANGNPTGPWTQKASMINPGDHAGAAYIEGITANGRIYAIGGEHDHGKSYIQHNFLSEYNPATNTWISRAPLPIASSHFETGVQVIHGRIVVFGGQKNNQQLMADVRSYDPVANAWSALTPLPLTRKGGATAFYNDRVWYTTGRGANATGGESYQRNTWVGTFSNRWW